MSDLVDHHNSFGGRTLSWSPGVLRSNVPQDLERNRTHTFIVVQGVSQPARLSAVRLGTGGGLQRIRYAAGGFLLTRRVVYEAIQRTEALPVCNVRFGQPIITYFSPLVVEEPWGPWYLSEDYLFCERARRAGYECLADTSLRLWHMGRYGFGWEDAGSQLPRYVDYRFHVADHTDE